MLPDFDSDIEMLAEFMPDSVEELEAQRDLLDFDWDQYPGGKPESRLSSNNPDMQKITFEVKAEYVEIIDKQIERVAGELDLTDGNALVALALGIGQIDKEDLTRIYHEGLLSSPTTS